MSWEWSHTPEAYDNALRNLERKSREWLIECCAEWQAIEPYDDDHPRAGEMDLDSFDQRKYYRAVRDLEYLPTDVLVDAVWDHMSEASVCDNGGHNAWACPSGCHTVSFDPEQTEESQRLKT